MSSLESPSVSLSKLESHRKSLRMFSQNHKSHPTQFNGPKWPNHTHAPLVLRTPSQFLAQERLWLSCTDTLWNANLRSSLSPSPGHHSPSQKNLFLLFLHSLFLSLCPQLIYPIGAQRCYVPLSFNSHKCPMKQMTKLKPRENQSLHKITQLVGMTLGLKPLFCLTCLLSCTSKQVPY